ncbi:hypothetical protein BH23PSE1_BH23PSE1_19160 [soil metagenome]
MKRAPLPALGLLLAALAACGTRGDPVPPSLAQERAAEAVTHGR